MGLDGVGPLFALDSSCSSLEGYLFASSDVASTMVVTSTIVCLISSSVLLHLRGVSAALGRIAGSEVCGLVLVLHWLLAPQPLVLLVSPGKQLAFSAVATGTWLRSTPFLPVGNDVPSFQLWS